MVLTNNVYSVWHHFSTSADSYVGIFGPTIAFLRGSAGPAAERFAGGRNAEEQVGRRRKRKADGAKEGNQGVGGGSG